VSGRDITEGRSTRAIAVELGIATSNIWQNTGDAYDVAIGGVPFLLAVNDQHPYERATAPFRKQQFDSQRDPGEQSLTGWWLRSQSSFHAGEGVQFYDPLANPYSTTLASNSYRYNASIGVDVTEIPGQVTLLRRPTRTKTTTSAYSIETVTVAGVDKILIHEDATLKLTDGTTSAYTTLSSSVATTIYASANDGLNAYYLDASNLVKVPLTGGATSSVRAITGTTNATMAYVKQRLVVGVNNAIYEFPTSTVNSYTITYTQLDNTTNKATFTTSINHSLRIGDRIVVASIATNAADYNGTYTVIDTTPNTVTVFNTGANHNLTSQSAGTLTLSANTPVYTHPNSSWVWTSITESGSAIYAAGYAGANSAIYKFTLDTTGAMPTLSSGITSVVVPAGEIIHNIYVHLMNYMAIGTNKGLRIGSISDGTGDITYGPLMIRTERPVRGFAAHHSYIYAASSSNTELGGNYPMIYRVDLSNEIDNLRFAYQTDIYAENTTGEAIDVCHLGVQDRLAFIAGTASNDITTVGDKGLWVQSATEVYPSGWIQTGYIRYNTLEQKNFKRVVARGDYGVAPDRFTPAVTRGSMTISTRDLDGNLFDVVSYDNVIGTPESTITSPSGAQDALGLRFTLFRDSTDISLSPIFKGYQLKAVPASPRERIIKVPLLNFDTETDKYNSTQGWEGRAFQRLSALESIESLGDVVTYQDFRTNEISQCLIEEVNFINNTPPDKKLTNFGGIILLTIRTV
jgi:hypothetical protein